MKRLLYGIVRAAALPLERRPANPDAAPLSFHREGELAAAYAPVADADQAATFARCLDFADVIHGLHRQTTIVPSRYGNFFDDDGQLGAMLRTRRTILHAVLADLDGRAEIGLRLLLDPLPQSPRSADPSCLGTRDGSTQRSATPASPGAAYLRTRKALYDRERHADEWAAEVIQRTVDQLGHLAVKWVAEPSRSAGRRLLSMCFLVPRAGCEQFLIAGRKYAEEHPGQPVLLTGPWPPYHFVGPTETPL